jgi:hypothetical protein
MSDQLLEDNGADDNENDEGEGEGEGESSVAVRGSKQATVAYQVCLALAFNEISYKLDSMPLADQCLAIKINARNWLDDLETHYKEFYQTIGNTDIERKKLVLEVRQLIEMDAGIKMLRKVKTVIIKGIMNTLTPNYIPPIAGVSGDQKADSLRKCIEKVWDDKEKDNKTKARTTYNTKKDLHVKEGKSDPFPPFTEYIPKPYLEAKQWYHPLWHLFIHFGIPAGNRVCLPIFTLNHGSGPKRKKLSKTNSSGSVEDAEESALQSGGRNLRRSIQLKSTRHKDSVSSVSKETDVSNDLLEANLMAEQYAMMKNYEGTQEWIVEEARLNKLINLKTRVGKPKSEIDALEVLYEAHLENPYVKILAKIVPAVSRPMSTPQSAFSMAPNSSQNLSNSDEVDIVNSDSDNTIESEDLHTKIKRRARRRISKKNRCITCHHCIPIDSIDEKYGKCKNCDRSLHIIPYAGFSYKRYMTCSYKIIGHSTNNQPENWCIKCFQNLEPNEDDYDSEEEESQQLQQLMDYANDNIDHDGDNDHDEENNRSATVDYSESG